jgi:hypothetical protein
VIDKGDREHLKKKDEEESAKEEVVLTKEQEESQYNHMVKDALKIAFDGIGISAKATTDDLISLAENDEADMEAGNATHRRKGLKLPAIYGSKQYEDHLYLGMVEINQLEEDDEMPNLLGDDYNKAPEGFDDPFANDADPFNPDDFNPFQDNQPLFGSHDANFAPPGAGAPPPPPPPGDFGSRTQSVPVPPPPPRQPAQQRASSDAHLPPHLREINRLK